MDQKTLLAILAVAAVAVLGLLLRRNSGTPPAGASARVRLTPPLAPPEMGQFVPRTAAEQLGRGDLIAARVKRGAPDHDPWRLEALGRDGEYQAWRFETEDAA